MSPVLFVGGLRNAQFEKYISYIICHLKHLQHPIHWRRFLMIPRRWFRSIWLILVPAFLLQWLVLFSIKGPTWDAVSYYIYARSAVFDQDLRFDNDYVLSYPTAGEHFESKQLDQIKTQTGRSANLFAVGSSLLWLPWLTLLRLGGKLVYSNKILTGYEGFFVTNIATLSALFGLLAYWIAFRLAREITNKRLALLSTITLVFATPLVYYQFREPMYSHATSALTVALVVYVWWIQHEKIGTPSQAVGLGALIGLAGLVRWQNLSYLLLPLVSMILLWWNLPEGRRKQAARPILVYFLLVFVPTLAVFSLQMSVWKVLFGSFVTIPQGGAFLDLRAPFLGSLLFSSFRGILPWMPVFFFAFAGLVTLSKQKPKLGLPLLLMLMVALYINGSTRDWFAGGGYGPRRFTGTLAILVVGYGAFLQWLPQRFRLWSAALLGIGLILHQWILLRYGLPERIGGRVISMQPTYIWEDIPLQKFATDMLNFVPQLWKRPLDFLVLPDSPLDLLLRQQVWPVQHLAPLLTTAIFLLLVITGGFYLGRRSKVDSKIVTLAIVILCLVNLWILVGSG